MDIEAALRERAQVLEDALNTTFPEEHPAIVQTADIRAVLQREYVMLADLLKEDGS
jgi:hypothetical protein